VPSKDLVISTGATEPVQVLRIAGQLHLPDVPQVMATLTAALRTPHRVAVCDVSGLVPPMNDSLLAAFPAALRRAGGWPAASLHLAAPGVELADRLRRLGLHRFLPIHNSLREALVPAHLEAASRRVELMLRPSPDSLRRARTEMRAIWPDAAPGGREEAVLVLNELASNAIQHVTEPYTVSLAAAHEKVLVAVTDSSRTEPVLSATPQSLDTDGRGMQLVTQLSQAWGVRLVHQHGKTVWAQLPVSTTVTLIPRSRPGLDH
jgi:hypothetical protein